jgi:nucleoside phosphorylase
MATVRTLILTAILPEAQALIQGLDLTKVAAPVPFWAKNDIALAVVGVRATRLLAIAKMPDLVSIQGVLMAGLGGALSPQLRVGDIVIDVPDAAGHLALTGAHTGAIHTADRIIGTPADKQMLFAATSSLAVDMEGVQARQFAEQRRAAFLNLRAISDAATDRIDPSLLQLVDENGRPRVGRAIAMLCRNPGKLRAMLRLQRASALALNNLSKAVGEILASGWPDAPTLPRQTA